MRRTATLPLGLAAFALTLAACGDAGTEQADAVEDTAVAEVAEDTAAVDTTPDASEDTAPTGPCVGVEDGAACDAPCFEAGACVGGACVGVEGREVTCPMPSDPCVDALACDPTTGGCTLATPAETGTACDLDADICTLDACDGAGGCLATGELETCSAETATNPCWTYSCVKKSGCAKANFVEGASCSDNNACTYNDTCRTGDLGQKTCLGDVVPIDDGNPCTDDACAEGVVTHSPIDGLVCQVEGDLCRSAGVCAGDVCEAPLVVDCDDDDPCTLNECAPETGQCAHPPAPDGTTCDDGDACTGPDLCSGGQCAGAAIADCCGNGACEAGEGCTCADCEGQACDDADACTAGDTCLSGQCLGTPQSGCCGNGVCEAGEACDCAVDCEGESCDDANACTTGETCAAGECGGGSLVVGCCGNGLCEVGEGCACSDCDGSPCDDGNSCTAGDACGSGTCQPGGALANCCGNGVCEAGEGCDCSDCDGETCDDANACTVGEICGGGACGGGAVLANCCGNDLCEVGEGCECADCDGEICDDANACTQNTTCQDGQCVGDPIPGCCGGQTCGDDEVCIDDVCQPATPTCVLTECPTLAGYTAACNAQDHCEYTPDDASGWRQHDVWIWVPPGAFEMGGPTTEAGAQDSERPVHTVTFAEGYFVMKYEVTVAIYEACEATGACETPPPLNGLELTWWTLNRSADGRASHPQNGLALSHAEAVCGWLSTTVEGAPATRVPTETEWEYAATGTIHRRYPWGDTPTPTCTNGTAWMRKDGSAFSHGGCGTSATRQVGTLPAGVSAVGALDMSGNVQEWVDDCDHDSYVGAPTDGSAWTTDCESTGTIVRGGDFTTRPESTRTAHRSLTHDTGVAGFGARCVRELPPEPQALECGGETCPPLGGYTAACNAQDHCEYTPDDASGWRQHDTWIWIPPGSFAMGAPEPELYATERPVHTVTFTEGFFVMKYELTTAAYEACEADGGCSTPATDDWDGGGWGTNRSSAGRGDHPQNGLKWSQASGFCAWVAPGGRLPSEAQWERVAKGAGADYRKFPWGADAPSCDLAVYNADGGGYGCGTGGTWPVGSKPAGASPAGTMDMAGNVIEWVGDCWHTDYQGAPTNGGAWTSGCDNQSAYCGHVRRGGSFPDSMPSSGKIKLHTSIRYCSGDDERRADFGARCVRPQ